MRIKIYNMQQTVFRPARYRLVLLLAAAFVQGGCSKKDDAGQPHEPGPCSSFKAPSVSNSGATGIGGTVTLYAITAEQDIDYEWTGPLGFSSAMAQPVLAGVQYSQNGVYRARIKSTTCTSSYAGTTVIVSAPCAAMQENTAVVGGTNWYFYSSVQCGPLGTNLYHGVTAACPYGILYIQFNTYAAPVGYSIYGVSPQPGIDTTLVSMRVNDSGTDFIAQAGSLYVGNNGSTTTFIFCGVSFKSAGSVSQAVKAHLRCY